MKKFEAMALCGWLDRINTEPWAWGWTGVVVSLRSLIPPEHAFIFLNLVCR